MASFLVWGVLEGMMVSLVLQVLCNLVLLVEQIQKHHRTFVERLEAHHNLTVVLVVSADVQEHYYHRKA